MIFFYKRVGAVLSWMMFAGGACAIRGVPPVVPADSSSHVRVGVGDMARLAMPVSISGSTVTCSAHDPGIVEVCGNGYCFGLVPGNTTVVFRASGEASVLKSVAVDVIPMKPRMQDAGQVVQFPRNRRFVTPDGRVCYGVSLNGREPQSSGTISNRIVNPHPFLSGRNGRMMWAVQQGTRMVDGAGRPIGVLDPRDADPGANGVLSDGKILPSCYTKIQHGMSKILGGHVCVYAFSTPVRLPDGRRVAASGWIPLGSVVDRGTLVERLHPGAGHLPALSLSNRVYRVTGGNPRDYATSSGLAFRIVKDPHSGAVAEHYLVRPTGVVNLLYAVPGFGLGGHSLDSFLVSGKPRFRAAKWVRPITVPTYWPPGTPQAGKPTPYPMTFLYGAVETDDGSPGVYGWIARAALSG